MLAASITLGHGISPSTATLVIAPQDDFAAQVGPLTFTYGALSITFYDCKVDRFSFDRGFDGKARWTLYLLDRRWRWAHSAGGGQISGYYNTRRNDNEIIEETKQNAQELAGLLLEAMGESNYDTTALADDQYPAVQWDYNHPAEELARLCENAGCRVVLGLDNSVRIVKLGEGADLPEGNDVLEDSLSVDIPEMPDEIICVAAKTRYQQDFELEPVALDESGEIVPLIDVSYNPEKGKDVAKLAADLPHFLTVDNDALRGFAQASAFRWYRIKEPFTLPGVKEKKLKRDRILPIESEQIDTCDTDDGPQNLPAWVYGIFYNERDDMRNNVEKLDPKSISKGSEAFYSGEFEIDRDLGIVKFAQPVYQQAERKAKPGTVTPDGKVNVTAAARLYLRTAVSLRDKKSLAWGRRSKTRKTGMQTGGLPRYIVKNETCLNVGSDGKDNSREVDGVLDAHLDIAMDEYRVKNPRSMTYAGLKPIELDGAIRQLIIKIGEDGTTRTRASRNREDLDTDVSYGEKRLRQRMTAAMRDHERQKDSTAAERDKGEPGRRRQI